MIVKNSWLWIIVAAGLCGLSYFHFQQARKLQPGPARVFAQLRPTEVTNIQVRLGRQRQISAERAQALWKLSEPVHGPADSTRIENLLGLLEHLTPAIYISHRELMGRPHAEEEYGFGSPQANLILKQNDYEAHLYLGSRTAPGDQVFLQVVGDEGIYVVSAELLNAIPQTANDWRDTTLLDLKALAFDRVAVTNRGKGFELRQDPTNGLWHVVISDVVARADTGRIQEFFTNVTALRIQQFISDEPGVDLETYGLQNPDFQFAVSRGTNQLALLQFGRNSTNDAKQVFARRAGQASIVTVDASKLMPWPAKLNFLDPHLISGLEEVTAIEVQGGDNFILSRLTNGTWQVLPLNFAADGAAVRSLCTNLSDMQIVQYKDIVIEQGLAEYGLDKPLLRYVFGRSQTNSSNTLSNSPALGLYFGTNKEDKVWVRRTDESSVYGVKAEDYRKLGANSWQFRDRLLWNSDLNDLASVTIRQGGKTRQLVRLGDHRWSLAAGSQGVIAGAPVEETVIDLVKLAATEWLGRGARSREEFGFIPDSHSISLEFTNGEKKTFELGSRSGPDFPVAAVTIEGESWIFAIDRLLCRDVQAYLSIPAGAP